MFSTMNILKGTSGSFGIKIVATKVFCFINSKPILAKQIGKKKLIESKIMIFGLHTAFKTLNILVFVFFLLL